MLIFLFSNILKRDVNNFLLRTKSSLIARRLRYSAMHLPTHTFVCAILTSQTREAARTTIRFKARDGHSDESRFRSLISCISNERARPGSTWTRNTLPCRIVRTHASRAFRTDIYVISVYVASSSIVSFDIGAFVLVLLSLICNGHVAINGWTNMMPAERSSGWLTEGGRTNIPMSVRVWFWILNMKYTIVPSTRWKKMSIVDDRSKR